MGLGCHRDESEQKGPDVAVKTFDDVHRCSLLFIDAA